MLGLVSLTENGNENRSQGKGNKKAPIAGALERVSQQGTPSATYPWGSIAPMLRAFPTLPFLWLLVSWCDPAKVGRAL